MNYDTLGVVAIVLCAAAYLGWRVYSILGRKRGQSTCPGCGDCEEAKAPASKPVDGSA